MMDFSNHFPNFDTSDPDLVKEEFSKMELERVTKFYMDCCDTKVAMFESLPNEEAKLAWAEKALINSIANIVIITSCSVSDKWKDEPEESFINRNKAIVEILVTNAAISGALLSMLFRMKFDFKKAAWDSKEVEELKKLYAES
jgi:hypothetical protein